MSKKFKESFGMGFGDRFCDCESDPIEYLGRTYDSWTMYGGEESGDVMFADDALRQDMEENGIDEEIMKMVDVWVNPRDRVEDAIDQITSDEMYMEGGNFWPTPENERIPIYTIELIRVDDDGSHDETPMQYQTFYYSDDTAFAAAENLADKFANEDGKFEVHIMAGEYVIDGSTDIYGDPYVDGSIQTGLGWKKAKMVSESYEVSDKLAKRLNSILADEFLASEAYRLAIVAMKGNKQHRLEEIAEKNGEDELEDHFKNLYEWMQSKGIKVVTDRDEMAQITNGTILKFTDGMSTKEIVDQLILSEEEAIDIYEDTIPHTELDLNTMLCGFLKDEREHLKELVDCRDEMGGGEKKSKYQFYEAR